MRTITDKMIKAFKKKLETEEKSKNTIEKYMRDICRFKEYADRFGMLSTKATCSHMPSYENTSNLSQIISQYKIELMKTQKQDQFIVEF